MTASPGLRLAASLLALGAGAVALVVAIAFLKTALG